MVYKWDDLRDDRLAVVWGENLHPNGTRRVRTLKYAGDEKRSWLSCTIVLTSTLSAIGIATLVALTLVKHPLAPIVKPDGNPSKAEGLELESLPVSAQEVPTLYPTSELSLHPIPRPTDGPSSEPTSHSTTSRPTTSEPSTFPSVLGSFVPSLMASELPSTAPSIHGSQTPSTSPSGVPKAPPAPDPVACIDQPGYFDNHAGDKVPCEWFSSVGTYNHEKNCEKTNVGRACLFSCREYNDCVLQTDLPSNQPSSSPSSTSSKTSTLGPTTKPPKSVTLEATADASIRAAAPHANMGSSSYLKIDGPTLPQDLPSGGTDSGVFHVLLRFDLTGHDASRPIESAALRLKAAKGCPAGGRLRVTRSPQWDETGVTWDTAPAADTSDIGRLGVVRGGRWHSIDVTSALRLAHKTLSLRLYPVGSDECLFLSKENSGSGGPELHIVYGDV